MQTPVRPDAVGRPSELHWDDEVDVLCVGSGPGVLAHAIACANSDADVLLHAITDALLGAAGLGDIGTHFPDTVVHFRGAGSAVVLA